MPVIVCPGHQIRITKDKKIQFVSSGTVIEEKDFDDFGNKKRTGRQQIAKWIERGAVRELGKDETPPQYNSPPIPEKIQMGYTFDLDPSTLAPLDLIQLKVMLQDRNIDPDSVPTKEGAIMLLSKDFQST